MSWFSGGKTSKSALSRLSERVFENSVFCAESLKPNLEEKFGKGTKEFQAKYFPVLFEFMCFFLHLTNRRAFDQLGPERRNRVYDELVPPTINAVIETFFGDWPQESKDGIEKDFYSNLGNTETEYGTCKELLLKPEEDTPTLEKIRSGQKSKSVVGQLTDNLSHIIDGQITLDPFLRMQVWAAVIDSLKGKEIPALVSEVSKEMK